MMQIRDLPVKKIGAIIGKVLRITLKVIIEGSYIFIGIVFWAFAAISAIIAGMIRGAKVK